VVHDPSRPHARGADGEYVSNARLENLSRADQEEVDEATVAPSAEDQYFSNPDPETLEAIAKALTPKQNEVFVGRVFSGKSVTEVAHDLNAKPNNVTKCYKSAQQCLRLAVINNPEGFGIEAWQIDKHIRAM
jgi:DNA-directed RNA polymerase specialized sigma24 family protein